MVAKNCVNKQFKTLFRGKENILHKQIQTIILKKIKIKLNYILRVDTWIPCP
jgi:hypothetical protein